jgi:hypothetical protein
MNEVRDTRDPMAIYTDTVYFTSWVHLFMLAFLIMCIYFFITLQVQGYPWPSLFFGAFAIFWIFIWFNARHLDFLITTDYIEFGFGVVKKRIKRSELLSCEPYQVRFRNYWGYGIRVGFDKSIAFISRSGPAVKMVLKDGKWSYVVNVNDPAKICDLLCRG